MRQKTQYDEWKSNDRVGDELLSQYPSETKRPSNVKAPKPHACKFDKRVIGTRRACEICGEPEPSNEGEKR